MKSQRDRRCQTMSRFVEKAEVSRDDLDFGVIKKHLFIEEGKAYTDISKMPAENEKVSTYADRFALWNQKDDSLLSVISSRYNAVEHGKIINALEEALDNLRLEPMDTKYYATPNRNLAWVDVQLKPREVIIEKNKDDWNVGIGILHGLDGIRGLQVSSFIQRVICSNGLRTTKLLGRERKTHRAPDLVGWFEKTTRGTLEDMDRRFKIIPKLFDIKIEMLSFEQKVEKLLGKRFMESVQEEIKQPSEKNPLYDVSEKLLSLYDALNVMTFIQNTKSEDVGARVFAQRHTRIENVVNSYLMG